MVPRPLPRDGVSPLLSMVGGKPRDGLVKPVKEPEDVLAPPISSSDEEDGEERAPQDTFVDSSDDDGPSRLADIVPTQFGAKKTSNKTTANNVRQTFVKGKNTGSPSPDSTPKRRSARQPAIPKTASKRTLEDVEDDDSEPANGHASKKKTKTPARAALGDHMQPGWHVESSIERSSKGFKAGYGKKAGKARNRMSSAERFNPDMLVLSSPGKPSTFKVVEFESDDASPVPNLKLAKRPKTKRKNKAAQKFVELQLEETPQKPELKMPEGYDYYAPKRDLVSFDMSLNETPADKERVLGPGLTRCPMCDGVVDEDSLEAFSKGRRMTIARQTKFCFAHKKDSARKVWKDNGYPEIDWQKLNKRVAEHHEFIQSLICGASSHFGTLHAMKINTGKNRTIFKTEEYPTPGYYGLRGISILTETIVETFSSLLRERAPTDKIISARGYTAFVQSVLVPELAVKLIQEDMGDINTEKARDIMEKSRAIGELLNDEKQEAHPKRAVQEAVTEEEDGDSSQKHDDSPTKKPNTKKGKKKDTKKPTELIVQAIADSDSELSSLDSPSMDDGSLIETRPRSQVQAVVVEDSDSDLSSLADL